MPRIRISYDLPAFKSAFVINFGGDDDAAKMLRELSNEARRNGVTPAALFAKAVLDGPQYLRGENPVIEARACSLIVAWALNQPSQGGGAVLDYLPVYDFEITITEIAGNGITYEVGATAREGLGTA